MLKLASPELERMILQQNGLVTPTPSSALPYLLKLKPELEPEPGHEQEQYAQGFAQEEKHSPINKDSDDSSDKKSATTEAITEPIDMQDQERIKLERKRLRNRIAASKCRRKKLDRIATLEEKVSQLKGENSELSTVVTKLRQQVCPPKCQLPDASAPLRVQCKGNEGNTS